MSTIGWELSSDTSGFLDTCCENLCRNSVLTGNKPESCTLFGLLKTASLVVGIANCLKQRLFSIWQERLLFLVFFFCVENITILDVDSKNT